MFKKFLILFLISAILSSQCSCSQMQEHYLKINILKVGKADAIILSTPSSAVLIDTGEKDDYDDILSKTIELGISNYDYLILSHFDKDHAGSVPQILDNLNIDTIIEPDYSIDSGTFERYTEAVAATDIPRIIPEDHMSFELDQVRYTFFMPQKDVYEDKNNYSIVVKAEYAESSILFTGDVLDERIEELLTEDISSTILKVPHHGSYEETSDEFYSAIHPQYSVITCSEKNPADEETIRCLTELESDVLLTADGDIEILLKDGQIYIDQ